MVKNVLKKSVSLFFSFALLVSLSLFPVAKASDSNSVIMLDERFLNPQECWREAGKHLDTGLSREQMTVEIYGGAVTKYTTAEMKERELGLTTGYVMCAVGGMAAVASSFFIGPAGLSIAAPICGSALGTGSFADWASGVISRSTNSVTLGSSSQATLSVYYALWYAYGVSQFEANITSALDSKVIDISGNSTNNGTKVQLWNNNGTSAQKFYILYNGDGWFNIFKAGTFKCLDVTGGKAEKGVNVQLWEYNGTKAQDWERVPVEGKPDYVYLKNRLGYYLDVSGGKSANGTQIWTWTLNETEAQQWKIA